MMTDKDVCFETATDSFVESSTPREVALESDSEMLVDCEAAAVSAFHVDWKSFAVYSVLLLMMFTVGSPLG